MNGKLGGGGVAVLYSVQRHRSSINHLTMFVIVAYRNPSREFNVGLLKGSRYSSFKTNAYTGFLSISQKSVE